MCGYPPPVSGGRACPPLSEEEKKKDLRCFVLVKGKNSPPAHVMFASIGAGFLAFVGVCSLMDIHALSADYTLPEPVSIVKEYYVDPKPAVPDAQQVVNTAYKAVTALRFTSPAAAQPAAQAETSAQEAEAAGREDTVPALPFTGGYFSARYSSLYAAPEPEEAEPAPEDRSMTQEGLTAQASMENAPQSAAGQEEDAATQKKVNIKEKDAEEKTVSVKASAGAGYSQMQSWKKVNSDVVGYLRIPGTNIDYPVVQGATNNTYTHLDIYKNSSRDGVIWADSDVKPGSHNTILYGHNWTNVSSNPAIGRSSDVMFAQLTAYQHASFTQSHPTIQYANANGDATWVVFATLYTTDLNSYIYTNVAPTVLAKWAKKQSVMCSSSIDINNDDQILTLSTCTRYFGQFENQRFVVMARKLRKGETLSSVTFS